MEAGRGRVTGPTEEIRKGFPEKVNLELIFERKWELTRWNKGKG